MRIAPLQSLLCRVLLSSGSISRGSIRISSSSPTTTGISRCSVRHFASATDLSTQPNMTTFRLTARGAKLIISEGDLTQWQGDAIVNAANERMLGGGGVDGAIHRRAGPGLLEACKAVPEVRRGVRCPAGEARITEGFNLPATHVIHTVGPRFKSHDSSGPVLANAYRNSMLLAKEASLKTIAFPAISCGVYGYPIRAAAEVALSTVKEVAEEWEGLEAVEFVLFGVDTLMPFSRVAQLLFEEWRDDEPCNGDDSDVADVKPGKEGEQEGGSNGETGRNGDL